MPNTARSICSTSTCPAARHCSSRSTAPGKAEAVVVDARDQLGFTFGLTTCYDVRFPELYVALARRGCDAILVPSAFTVPTGEAHWHLLLRARAVESQSYILAAAQSGAHNEKRRSYGHALAVDPWGVVVGDAGDAGAIARHGGPRPGEGEIDPGRRCRSRPTGGATSWSCSWTMDKLFARDPFFFPTFLRWCMARSARAAVGSRWPRPGFRLGGGGGASCVGSTPSRNALMKTPSPRPIEPSSFSRRVRTFSAKIQVAMAHLPE